MDQYGISTCERCLQIIDIKAYADWDILDMEEFSQAVFLGAEQADSIQAVVDYNYDLLDAIEVLRQIK